ncbi:MAG: lipoprotein [Xanthobacteraceae bacterium]|nr:lipoprotein [Xanthobacteraceae bacterium]
MADRSNRIVPMALLAGTLVLAGCGVKGPLEPPLGAENTAAPSPLQTTVTPDSSATSVTSTKTVTTSSRGFTVPFSTSASQEPKKKRLKQGNVPVTSKPPRPDRGFILDDLL